MAVIPVTVMQSRSRYA